MVIKKGTYINSAEEMGDRKAMTEFWTQYASAPTVQTMMLNADAQNWDENDRLDVIGGLPEVAGMDVIELGAGIGRFTKYFAQNAKHVYATDFIESFLQKNKELHATFNNITYRVGDAVNQEFDDNSCSCDLVFTNWLMMYLTDEEVIQFCMNALFWLRPGGYFHVRESCTEASTKAPKKLVCNENPTFYRHSSLYMRILNNIRYKDIQTGTVYGFKLQWAKSINTYVEIKGNWRQVHMILNKVAMETGKTSLTSREDLLEKMHQANKLQEIKEQLLNTQITAADAQLSPVETLLLKQITSLDAPIRGLLNLNASMLNSFTFSQQFNCCVEALENNFYMFSAMLTQANKHNDKRVRFQWTDYVAEPWQVAKRMFDMAVGVDISGIVPNMDKFLRKLRKCMKHDCYVVLIDSKILEPFNGLSKESINSYGYELVAHKKLSEEVKQSLSEMKEKFENQENVKKGQELAEYWQNWYSNRPQWTMFTFKTI